MKYKCVDNYSQFDGEESNYLTAGKVYEFEMHDDEFGTTIGDSGGVVYENLTKQYHARWEKIE